MPARESLAEIAAAIYGIQILESIVDASDVQSLNQQGL